MERKINLLKITTKNLYQFRGVDEFYKFLQIEIPFCVFMPGGHSTNLIINCKPSARLHKHAVGQSTFEFRKTLKYLLIVEVDNEERNKQGLKH